MNLIFERFVDKLEARLKEPLPGEEYQFLMAPLKRLRIREVSIAEVKPRPSAVLVLLYPLGEKIMTVLIERPVYEGIHSGQVAFPGGKFDEGDGELSNTALRETFEEIGIPVNEISILGHLTDLYISPSNFMVTPFIGSMRKLPHFIPNPREVKKIIT
ncbi:MAG TPA: CoA pyrophosphatase [Bacteroidia bacterium]|jgi:8-oxo-dGTP pyrophosphatase MutT (NUDIX family)